MCRSGEELQSEFLVNEVYSEKLRCSIMHNMLQQAEAYPSLKGPTFGNVSTLINMLVLYFTFAQYQYLEDI